MFPLPKLFSTQRGGFPSQQQLPLTAEGLFNFKSAIRAAICTLPNAMFLFAFV